MSINISWSSEEGVRNIRLPLPLATIDALYDHVEQQLGVALSRRSHVFTDTSKDILSDEDVVALQDGATLVVASRDDGALAAPAHERISFQPHPKTLTMAGDYEYFAAQGRHPFVYAVAEFIDNSLRATRNNAPKPRSISVTIMTTGNPKPGTSKKGLVCIADNGCGMTKQELNEWAVMNYSMQERGVEPREPEAAIRGSAATGAGRFLTGDLSFFGVGSKNAAFFMGSFVKVSTRKAGERYVHELSLAAADLEARYRNQQAVYEEDMVHRNPGDHSTANAIEQAFPAAREWVRAEVEPGEESFTRVIIGDLKADVIDQLVSDDEGAHICTELAHLYHYYLHGENGNRKSVEADESLVNRVLPNGEPLPRISLRRCVDLKVLWERSLAEVDEDFETRILRGQRSELSFSLGVPQRGVVTGVLYYFPFEGDRETVPMEDGHPWSNWRDRSYSRASTAGTQAMGAKDVAQLPVVRTQAGATGGLAAVTAQTQYGVGGPLSAETQDTGSDDDDAGARTWRTPTFEAFWQGRLIPGARIDSLPFIESVRQKRNAHARDVIPDEAFGRLRGALFFGPAFRVTRNKLLFRDNLEHLLAEGVPGDRNMEKRFRDWLSRCHATLDKSMRFENLADTRTQATVRTRLGEGSTAFLRISDGQRTICAGDVIRLTAKPAVVGRVAYFTVPQVVRQEGSYANGRIHIEQLPEAVHGKGALREFSMRRYEALLTPKEVDEHCQREESRIPTSLRVEPMRFGTGEAIELSAGASVPETTLLVLNGAGQKVVRSYFNGEKQALVVTQRLWMLPVEGASLPGEGGIAGTAQEEGGPVELHEEQRPAKRIRKGRKGKRQNENEDQNTTAATAAPAATETVSAASSAPELVVTVENRTPYKESFVFSRISDGLKRAGHYALEFCLTPAVSGQASLRTVVPLRVLPGQPTAVTASGEGVVAASMRQMLLGETFPVFKLHLVDEFGNHVPAAEYSNNAALRIAVFEASSNGDTGNKRCANVGGQGEFEYIEKEDCWEVMEVIVKASGKAAAAFEGLDLFKKAAELSLSGSAGAQRTASQVPLAAAPARLGFCMRLEGGCDILPALVDVQLQPGAPHTLRLLPGNPWETESAVNVASGAELPEFRVQALDYCGNVTAPTSELKFAVDVESASLVPNKQSFEFNARGVAIISGLRAITGRSGQGSIVLRSSFSPSTSSTADAVERFKPQEELELELTVLPSIYPVAMEMLCNGEPVYQEEAQLSDGKQLTYILKDIQAGAPIKNLSVRLLDEAGEVAAMATTGKMNVSWHRGTKKIKWNGEPIKLPVLVACESVTEQEEYYVRFNGDAIMLECCLLVQVVPGTPDHWALTMLDTLTSQSPDQSGVVHSGQPFTLEIAPMDKYNNNCGTVTASDVDAAPSHIPVPVIALESDTPLEYDADAWETRWVLQGKVSTCQMTLTVSGHPGQFKAAVHDAGGEDGSSVLEPDAITMELRPGPPHTLAFEGIPPVLECGTRAVLGPVEVSICDASGHPTAALESFEIALVASALSTDGSGRAAKVVATGGNKIKVTKGRTSVRYKNVTVTAEAPGTYAVRVQSSSRKVAVQEGVLTLQMTPQAVATALQVIIPPDLAEGCPAGSTARLLVSVETENGEPLPEDAIARGLSLRVKPPTRERSRSDSIVQAVQTSGESNESISLEDGCYVFRLANPVEAGTWAAVAEYSEPREDVRASLGKAAQLRSSGVQFEVDPGPPFTAAMTAQHLPDRLAVTNASSQRARLLLRNAAAHLQDAYGNAAIGEGVQMRFILRGSEESLANGAVLPDVVCEEGSAPLVVDDRGRVYFGMVSISEGTGKAPSGALDCELICEALGLYPSSVHDLETNSEGWSVVWQCPVIFSDNAAQFAMLEKLNQQQEILAERRQLLEHRLQTARAAVDEATKAQQHASEEIALAAGRVTGGAAPCTVREAQEALSAAEQAAASGNDAEPRAARWGSARAPVTASIDAVLRSGDPGVVGVFAQLITIADERLACVASAAIRSMLPVVVLRDAETRKRLVSSLQAKKYPLPDMASMTQLNAYHGQNRADIPGFKNAGDLAKALTSAACTGTDPPLPLPLPHQRRNKDARGFDEWPSGCLGYLINLVRPVRQGYRATLVHGLLSGYLLFETIDHAAAYREYVTQTLKMPCGADLITLEGGRISSRGITSGSSFRPVPLDKADYVIGGHGDSLQAAADRVEALRDVLQAMRRKEAAQEAIERAQTAVKLEESKCQPEMDEVEAELRDIDAQLAALQTTGCDGNRGKQSARKPKVPPDIDSMVQENDEKNEEAPAVDVDGSRPKRRRLVKRNP